MAAILLVDDNPANLLALEEALKELGQGLVSARSGSEALRRLLEQDFALILLDVQMPEMDGFETAALIRRRERSRGIPIIFMTAYNKAEEHITKGYSHGAADYVFKPIIPEVLRAKARVFVDLYEKTETIRRQARELARSNAELEQFAYAASHDLKEPLRKIAGFIQLLERKYRGRLDDQAEKYIRAVVDGAARMEALIGDLLEYSRAGAPEGPPQRLDSVRALQQALSNLEALLRETRGRVTHGRLPVVRIEQVQLVRVFQNLVGNALKFHGGKAPRVHVSVQRREEDWVFSVADNGIGIPPEHQDRVFSLFKRLHPRDKYGGTGIGLPICKKIVESYGGSIWVESAPGKGTDIRFTLPAAEPAAVESAAGWAA